MTYPKRRSLKKKSNSVSELDGETEVYKDIPLNHLNSCGKEGNIFRQPKRYSVPQGLEHLDFPDGRRHHTSGVFVDEWWPGEIITEEEKEILSIEK